MIIFPLLILFAAGILAFNPDHWHTQIMFGESAFVLWLSYEIKKRVHLIPALVFLYFGLCAAYSIYWPVSFSATGFDIVPLFESATARSFLFLLIVLMPFIFSDKKDMQNWEDSFLFFGWVNCFVMIANYFHTGAATGLIGMDSVDGSFLAILLPLAIFSRFSNLISPVFAVALLLSKSSTVYGMVFLELILYLVLFKKKIKWAILPALLVVPLGKLYLGKNLAQDNGRFSHVKMTIDVFHQLGHEKFLKYIFGVGQGSFIVIMPFVQGINKPFFAWLHNEPIQVLFEQGIVGLVLLAGLYFVCLYRTRKSKGLFLALAGAGFQSFLQPCFRYFIFALLMAFICRISFENDTQSN